MIINLRMKNIEVNDESKKLVHEHSEKLSKYFEGRIHITWNFELERNIYISHCHMVGNHMDYFGEGRSDGFALSVDLALEKIERQLKKHKEIVTDHLHRR